MDGRGGGRTATPIVRARNSEQANAGQMKEVVTEIAEEGRERESQSSGGRALLVPRTS